jgi:hypothetical protein
MTSGRRGATVFTALAAAAILCACGSATAGGSKTRTLSERDKGHTVTVAKGAKLVLRLHNVYWTIRGSSNSAVVRQTGPQKKVPGGQQQCIPGAGCGTVTAPFRAVGGGSAKLTASRRNCGEALLCTPAQSRFSVTIRVRG